MRKISALLPLVLSLALFPACGKMAKKKDMPGPNDKVYSVGVANVVSRNIPDAIDLKGDFSPFQRLQVKSDFTGKVQALSVIEGQQISAGEVLLKIDDEKLPYVLDRQRAELREAEAQLELNTSGNGFDENPAEVEEELFGQDLVEDQPLAEEDNLNTDSEALPEGDEDLADQLQEPTESTPFPRNFPAFRRLQRRALRQARQRSVAAPVAPQVPQEVSENRIALDQARIDRIRAELTLSERQLAGSTLQATIDGFIARVGIAEGSMVKQDDVLVEIVQIDPIELILQIPKQDIARLDKSMEVKVTVPDLNNETFSGEISFIGAELDPVKKSLELRVRVANQSLRIKGGMEGVAHLAIANKAHQGLMVPSGAILNEGEKSFVYVLKGQVAEKRAVQTGVSFEGLVEVKSGLKSADRVVVNGLAPLKEDEEFVKVSTSG